MDFLDVSHHDPVHNNDNQKDWYISAEDLPEEIIGAVGFYPQESFLENQGVDFEDQTLIISVQVDYETSSEAFTFALLVGSEGLDPADNGRLGDTDYIIHAHRTIRTEDLVTRDTYDASHCLADFLKIISESSTKEEALRRCEEVVLRRYVSEV